MVQRRTPVSPISIESAALDPGGRYSYDDKARVLAFLAKHSDFVAILREAAPEIAQRFGADTKVVLRVDDDPERVEDDTLWGLIEMALSPDEALDRLRRLDEEYWIERSTGVHELLALNLRFVR